VCLTLLNNVYELKASINRCTSNFVSEQNNPFHMRSVRLSHLITMNLGECVSVHKVSATHNFSPGGISVKNGKKFKALMKIPVSIIM